MGAVRSPKIAEQIEEKAAQIEKTLDFLCKELRAGEEVTLTLKVTQHEVCLQTNLEVDIKQV